MRILHEYTIEHLKNNKRHTAATLLAISIAAALLFSLCIFMYTFWQSKIDETIERGGDWQGELWSYTKGDKLEVLSEHPEVKSVMLKGDWETIKLDSGKRPYLLLRDANKAFWEQMSLKNTLIEGRIPQKNGEIVVSKLFFADNPTYAIGDTLELPIGNRIVDGHTVSPQETEVEGEDFKPLDTKTFTIVGKLDLSSVSAYPGYISMGYVNNEDIADTDHLTLYFQLVHPRKVYSVMPELAKVAELEQDADGDYSIRYNTPLLTLYGITNQSGQTLQLTMIIAMVVIFAILIMGAFVLIIVNAFMLSANSRSKQLGALKSLGATPKQIRQSMIFEGICLWFPGQCIGMLIGYAFTYGLVQGINRQLEASEAFAPISMQVSIGVMLVTMAMTFIVVLLSAYIPARRVAKVTPIVAIKQLDEGKKVKRDRETRGIDKIIGVEGMIAKAQFRANRKSFRTAIISLSMCFLLLISYLSIMTIVDYAQSSSEGTGEYTMGLDMNITFEPDKQMIADIEAIEGIEKSVLSRRVRTVTYVQGNQESEVFKSLGGFESVNNYKYNVSKSEKGYRLITKMIGLDEASYKAYAQKVGMKVGISEPSLQREEPYEVILYDTTYHKVPNEKKVQLIPMLNVEANETMALSEHVDEGVNGDYVFETKLGAVTGEKPSDMELGRYNLAVIYPMSVYNEISENFAQERELESRRVKMDFVVSDADSVRVREAMESIISRYLGSEDYTIWSLHEDNIQDAIRQKALYLAVISIAAMIGLIGLFNTYSTISNNLRMRRREFAMLRSIGLTPKGLTRELWFEGFFLGITPILVSIPLYMVLCFYMLNITLTTLEAFMLIMPWGTLLIITLVLLMTVGLSYGITARHIGRESIIEGMKDETL